MARTNQALFGAAIGAAAIALILARTLIHPLRELRSAIRAMDKGIAPAGLPHVFNRFYRGDQSRQQQNGESGLGLAIAKSLVELHHGLITVESELGCGTTFEIVLPGS
jgi:signal transduction histidine kinase